MQLDMQSRLTLNSSEDSKAFGGARSIDARAVRQWLADRRLQLRPSLRTIAKLAAKYFGLRVAELTSPSRRRAVVQARGIAMYLGRQLTAKSLEQLGNHFGGRDHTTVLHNYRSIEARLCSDPTTRRAVSDIRKALAHA
jgi:chromosomal replication initiator protein